MAILNGELMPPGLIRFAPLEVKSVCPQTRDAFFEPEGNSSTRLLALSVTTTLLFGSILTSA